MTEPKLIESVRNLVQLRRFGPSTRSELWSTGEFGK
jgi:hypothetical protein